MLKYDNFEEPSIIFIFFPVSPSFYINSLFESYIGEFNMLKSNFQKVKISEILEKAQNVMQKRYRQFKTYQIQDSDYLCPPKQEKYKVDEFLFGDLAAKYLTCNKQFPYILLEYRIYAGIPLNFTLNSFISNIIFKELGELSY